jgi:ribonuclease HI
MTSRAPHYLLFSDANPPSDERRRAAGRWRFVLQSVEDDSRLEAQDREREMSSERLELLAVVRGLEALDQPSRVTLVTPSRYVSRGLRYGLEEWRDNRWRWERHGRMVPIKNNDLWKRVDRAMKYHEVECRIWRFDSAHDVPGPPRSSRPRDSDSTTPKSAGRTRESVVDGRTATNGTWLGRWFATRPTQTVDSPSGPEPLERSTNAVAR